MSVGQGARPFDSADLFAYDRGLDRASGFRGFAVYVRCNGSAVCRCVFRGHVGDDHDGIDGLFGIGCLAEGDQPLAGNVAMAWRDRDHCCGDGVPSRTSCGRDADFSLGSVRDDGENPAAGNGHCGADFGYLCRADRVVHDSLSGDGDVGL